MSERKSHLSSILCKFRILRKIYRARQPLVDYPEETKNYKKIAIEMGKELIENFHYVVWPNYLHKIIEHVQELIERPNGPGTVGGLSGEGNEGGNKIFRHFRKNFARKGSTQGGLRDVLCLHWLYSSPALVELADVTHKTNRCGLCLKEGHDRRTCPLK